MDGAPGLEKGEALVPEAPEEMLMGFVITVRKAVCLMLQSKAPVRVIGNRREPSVTLRLAEFQQINQARQRAAALSQEITRKDLLSRGTVLHGHS